MKLGLNFWLIEILIVILSIIMNWGVQLSYYLWRKHKDSHAFVGQKTLLNYYTGYLGDGIIVPLINILIFYIIYSVSQMRGIVVIGLIGGVRGLYFALAGGLAIDIVAHYLQGKLKLTNWSMPAPYHWNFAGYWHMVSFPIQMGYLVYFFWFIRINWNSVISATGILLSSLSILGLMVLFVVLYCLDNKWI